MANLVTRVNFDRRDKDNNLLENRSQLSRSWTRKFIDLWYVLAGNGTNTLSSADISNTLRTLSTKSGNLQVWSPPGGITFLPMSNGPSLMLGQNLGIVVGTSATAVTPADYALNAIIAHGASTGQLWHHATDVYGHTIINPNASFNIVRLFTNNSGGSITINEVGIYALGSSAYSFCICHDVVSPGVTVNNTEILSVIYTVQITV